jgi:hypothetical protein
VRIVAALPISTAEFLTKYGSLRLCRMISPGHVQVSPFRGLSTIIRTSLIYLMLVVFLSPLSLSLSFSHLASIRRPFYFAGLASSRSCSKMQSSPLMSSYCSISDAFDGGNIEYIRTEGNAVYLNVKSDP